jgi:Skp family chaperone for outer membrane proteins
MRMKVFCGTLALALACATVGVAQDKPDTAESAKAPGAAAVGSGQEKSQQNSADESVVKGDLDAAKKSGDPRKLEEAEKKLEDAVDKARSKGAAEAGKPVEVGPRFSDLNEQQRRAIYDTVKGHQAAAQRAPDVGPAQVGAVLPPNVELRTLPGDLTGRIPGTSTFRYVLSGDRVLIVEPTERIVVGVLEQ